jgi:hypothetical protein
MPKLLYARPPANPEEEQKIRKLAGSRHAPADWVMRARMIAASWGGARTSTIAAHLGCHMQTVRERLARFNAEGLDGLGDRPGMGRRPPHHPSRAGTHHRPRPFGATRPAATLTGWGSGRRR